MSDKQKKGPWARVTLHRIDKTNVALNAALLTALAHAGEVTKSMGGKFPVHVRIDAGDDFVCGSVEPASVALAGGELLNPAHCDKRWS